MIVQVLFGLFYFALVLLLYCIRIAYVLGNLFSLGYFTLTRKSAAHLDIEIVNVGRVKVNFLFISSNIPASPAYGVYI